MAERYRPGRASEEHVRVVVKDQYPAATSQYTRNGAVVYDTLTGRVLGKASGDWAVE